MRIRRGPLFWGLLLVLLGGIPLLVRAGALDGALFADLWRLWPLILIGIGLAIVLGRRRAGLAVTVILALAFGFAGGGALASGNFPIGDVGDCIATQATLERSTQAGTFEEPASVRLEIDCGDLRVSPTATSAWSLTADHVGTPPVVTATRSSLRVAVPDGSGARRQQWTLELPAAPTRDLTVTANAGASTFDLGSMTLDRFRAEVNAGDLRLDASEGRISRLEISMNAGRARVSLGTGSTVGSLAANAGALELCVPPTSELVLHVTDQLLFSHNLERRGLSRSGDTWTRSGAGNDTIDLSIDGNAASLTLDPDGGC